MLIPPGGPPEPPLPLLLVFVSAKIPAGFSAGGVVFLRALLLNPEIELSNPARPGPAPPMEGGGGGGGGPPPGGGGGGGGPPPITGGGGGGGGPPSRGAVPPENAGDPLA